MVVVSFYSLVRIWGEILTIRSLPVLFVLFCWCYVGSLGNVCAWVWLQVWSLRDVVGRGVGEPWVASMGLWLWEISEIGVSRE